MGNRYKTSTWEQETALVKRGLDQFSDKELGRLVRYIERGGVLNMSGSLVDGENNP